jgi:hypothetical protein
MKKLEVSESVKIFAGAGLAALVVLGGIYIYFDIGKIPGTRDVSENGSMPDATGDAEAEDSRERAAGEGAYYSNWQTHKDEEYDFEIKYPENFEFGGPNPEEKLLFSLTGPSDDIHYEFWVQNLSGKTVEEVFEEKLNLTDMSYFEWIRSWGGEISEENIGGNTWLFVDGSAKFYLDSHYMVLMPNRDAYLVVDLGFPKDAEFETVKDILASLRFAK